MIAAVVLLGSGQVGGAAIGLKKVDPCTLLTTEELESVAGVPFSPGEFAEISAYGPQCRFPTVGTSASPGEPPVGNIFVSATRGKKAKADFKSALQFIKDTGNPEAVTGLGGKAYFSDSEGGLLPELLVLRKKTFLSVSGGISTPDLEVIDLANLTELAKLALDRL